MTGRRRVRFGAPDGESAIAQSVFDATEVLLVDTPLHELTVAQIIKAAGVSRASFYHYFSSKYDVVAALVSTVFDHIFAETESRLRADWANPREVLYTSLGLAVQEWERHRNVINGVLENQHAVDALADMWAKISGRFAEVLARKIESEVLRGRAVPTLNPDATATMLVCGAERIFYVGAAGFDPHLATAQDALDAVVSTCLAAIYGDPSGPSPASTSSVHPARTPVEPTEERRTEFAPASSKATRRAILVAMMDLLQELPLRDLSVNQIIEGAGTSRVTFYAHFASRDAAFVALISQVMSGIVPRFEALMAAAAAGHQGPGELQGDVVRWLSINAPERAIVRTALEEWPRQPQLRQAYLTGQRRLASALADLIRAVRDRGQAAESSVSPEQLASGWLWTMEWAWYESVGGAGHLPDLPLVNHALAETLVALVHGTV